MEPISIEFTSEGICVRGRFFITIGMNNPTTMLFIPGWPADAEDFLGLGPNLSQQGINLMELYPRGLQTSEGTYTHSGALKDIEAALQ